MSLDTFSFNQQHGYLEGLLRGLYASLYTRSDYMNMAQSHNLEDLKAALLATGITIPSKFETGTMHATNNPDPTNPNNTNTNNNNNNTSTEYNSYMELELFDAAMKDKMLKEFKYFYAHSYEPLTQMLDFISYGYMIDNIALLIRGRLYNSALNDLLKKCHPLGWFEGLSVINTCNNAEEIYNAILINTPLAEFFAGCVSQSDFDDLHVEIIRNTVYKNYLTAFYRFVTEKVGGLTGEVMQPLLRFESDRRNIMITLNSIEFEVSREERMKFYTEFGYMSSHMLSQLSKCSEPDKVRQIAAGVSNEYQQMLSGFEDQQYGEDAKSMEDEFLAYEVKLHHLAFLHQFNMGVFYSYFKLLEQQSRNVTWLAECITQQNKQRVEANIKVYDF